MKKIILQQVMTIVIRELSLENYVKTDSGGQVIFISRL